MSEKLGDALLELKTDSKKFDKGIKKAEKRTGKLETKLKKAGLAAKLLKSKLIAIGAAIVVGIGITKAIQRVTMLGDEIAKMSKKTGIATETLSSFRLVMDLGGTSIQSFAKGMKTLSKMMFDIRSGAGAEAAKAFDAIKISTENADGSLRDVLDVFFDISEEFSRMKDGAEKAAIAQTILGRAGLELIPTLNMGSAEIRKQVQLAKDLGLQFSKLEGEQMEAFNDAVTVLTTSLFALWQRIVIDIMPTLTKMADKLTAGIVAFKTWRANVNAMTTATFDFNKALKEQAKISKEVAELSRFRGGAGFPFVGGPKGIAEELNELRTFRGMTKDVKVTEAALVDLDKEIKLKGEDLEDMADAGDTAFQQMRNAVTGWASGFSSTLTDMVFNAETSFGNILESFGRMLTQMVIQKRIVEPFLTAFLGGAAVSPSFVGPPAPTGLQKLGGFLGLADGGIVNKPTAAIIGEGKEPEVVAPLSKLERMGGNIEVNVYAPPGSNVRTQQGTTAQGGRRMDVILDEEVAQNVRRTGSKTNLAIATAFGGVNNRLVGR